MRCKIAFADIDVHVDVHVHVDLMMFLATKIQNLSYDLDISVCMTAI